LRTSFQLLGQLADEFLEFTQSLFEKWEKNFR